MARFPADRPRAERGTLDPMDETGAPTTLDDGRPRWRGINHLALVTPDMDATVRFYHGVLGMRLVRRPIGTGRCATTSSRSATENTVAFFEWTARRRPETFAKPAGIPTAFADPVRPPLVQPARRGGPASRCRTGSRAFGVRGHRRRRPRLHALRSTSPTRTASRSRPAGGSSTPPAGPPTYDDRPACSPTPTRCPPSASSPPPVSWPGPRPPSLVDAGADPGLSCARRSPAS